MSAAEVRLGRCEVCDKVIEMGPEMSPDYAASAQPCRCLECEQAHLREEDRDVEAREFWGIVGTAGR